MFNLNYKNVLGIIGGVALLGFGIRELIERISYDGEGYNKQGYDGEGFDRQGYNSEGYDRRGFDVDGYDKNGFNWQRCDAEGFDKQGYGIDGFNREGLDRQGYGRDKYNCSGIDRAGHCRQFYSDRMEQLRCRLDEAYQQLQHNQYRYAIYDARVVMEEALKLLVLHSEGHDEIGDKMSVNLKICENKQLLGDDREFMDRLHSVRHICNANGHELEAEKNTSHKQVYFVIMQIRDLLSSAEGALDIVLT